MHSKRLLSLLLVAILVAGPVFALGPDALTAGTRGAPETAASPDGSEDPGSPSLDAAAELVRVLDLQVPELFVEAGQDDPLAALQHLPILAYDQLALTVNAARGTAADVHPAGQNVHLYMARGNVDRDADGVPDFYTLHAGHGFGVPAAPGNHTLYLQADFIDGPTADGRAFVIDPSTGVATGAELVLVVEDGRVILNILRDGTRHSSLTLDLVDFENTLVYRVHDEQDRYIESPRHEQSAPLLEVEWGDPVWFSAPADQSFVRLWPPYDMDADGLTNEREVPVASHPLNGRSLPGNLDGDACDWYEEPGVDAVEKRANDEEPSVCLPFAYDLQIMAPDSDPNDGLDGHVWDAVPLTVTAQKKSLPGVDPEDVPRIKHWELWLTFANERFGSHLMHGGSGPAFNRTVINNYGDYKHPEIHDQCDYLPAEPPPDVSWPEEGVTHDGDPVDHSDCGFFMDPFEGDDEVTIRNFRLGGGTGSFQALDETVQVDTSQYLDGEYHIFMYVCLENEHCARPFVKMLDVRDHFAWTPHIQIANKPSVRPLDVVDVDGFVDRPNADFSGLVNLTFEVVDPRGHPVAWLNHSVDAWTISQDGERQRLGRETWMYDVLGMQMGETRQELDVTPRYDAENDRIVADVAPCELCRTTLKKIEDRPGGGLYVLTSDSRDYPWGPRMIGGDISLGATARIGSEHSAEGHALRWPAQATLRWFNNRPPVVSALEGPTLESEREEGLTHIGFRLHYRDPDANGRSPTFAFTLTDPNGNTTEILGACEKMIPVGQATNPPPNSDADYACDFSTRLAGSFTWTLAASDTDQGDGTSVVDGAEPIVITNGASRLADGLVATDTVRSAGSNQTRVMDFQVRYTDPDDAPAGAWIEIYRGHGPEATFVGSYEMDAATDCIGDVTASSEATTDLCASRELPLGDHGVRFRAVGVRGDNATFPEEGRLEFTVGALVAQPCPPCGSDEEAMTMLATSGKAAIGTANDLFVDLPPLVHPRSACVDPPHPWLPGTLLECDPLDADGDGYRDDQEVGVSDPHDPWSTPLDPDADLVPDVLERGPLDVNLFTIKGGRVAMATDPYIAGYLSFDRNDRTQERFRVSLLREGELYNVTLTPTSTQRATFSGLLVLDYTVTETGFEVRGSDINGFERLVLSYDGARIGGDGRVFSLWLLGQAGSTHEVWLETAPLALGIDDEVATLPLGFQAEPDGTYSVWSDLDGDGEREPVPPA